MTDQAKCKTAGCAPVLQTRGEMGKGDYFGVRLPDGRPDLDHHEKVELTDPARDNAGNVTHPGNKTDCRIACRTCALATPWTVRDAPGMADVGVQYSEKQWAEAVAAKDQKSGMLDCLRDQFGQDAIDKHFGLAL